MTRLSYLLFNVEYGGIPEKACNTMTWLENETFVEIYQSNGLSSVTKLFIKLSGYNSIFKRMEKWDNVRHGRCEWSIESPEEDLKKA